MAKMGGSKLLFRTILGLDQYLYNTDRCAMNPNILYIPQKNEINVIDYSHAIWSLLDYETEIAAPIPALKEHILSTYAREDKAYIAKLITNVYDVTIDNYIDTIPDNWFTEDLTKEFLRQFLAVRRDNIHKILKEIPYVRTIQT
jgi:hypothetical protein